VSSDRAGGDAELLGGLLGGQAQQNSQGDHLALAFGKVPQRSQERWINHVDHANRLAPLSNALHSL
jgi:hypothetical protein